MTGPAPARVVEALVDDGLLAASARERATVVVARALEAPSPEASRGMPQVVEVVAYLGGALVLAAAGLFVAQEWAHLGFGTRTTLLALATLVLAGAGLVAGRGSAGVDVRRRLGGTLLTGAALTAAFLVGYVLNEVTDPSRTADVFWPAVAGAAVGAVVSAVGYRLVPTALGLAGALVGVLLAVGNAVGGLPEGFPGTDGDQVGLAFLVIAALWLLATERDVLGERQVARALGCVTALVGAQAPVVDGTHAEVGYALTVVVAVAGVAAYLRLAGWPYLALAVLGVTLVVPEAVSDWTAGSLGAVGGVLVAGITLLLASLAGFRLRREA